MQPLGTRAAESVGAGGGADACHEQGLRSIDVAHPHHDAAGQQHLLDAGAMALQRRMKSHRIEARRQRLHPQAVEQLAGRRCGFALRVNDGAKAPGIVQAQRSPVGQQIKVVMRAGRREPPAETQAAGHAQMHQQQAFVQVEQQVLATPAHRLHHAIGQRLRLHPQGPAQRLAQAGLDDPRPCNPVGETPARHLHFRQFGHRRNPWSDIVNPLS